MTYTLREGEIMMCVDGEMYELKKAGQSVEVRPGQAYQDFGVGSMLVRSEPPFDPEQSQEVEPLIILSMQDELALSSHLGRLVI
jgi:hypothetical protein